MLSEKNIGERRLLLERVVVVKEEHNEKSIGFLSQSVFLSVCQFFMNGCLAWLKDGLVMTGGLTSLNVSLACNRNNVLMSNSPIF
jgi:hypothetical protein